METLDAEEDMEFEQSVGRNQQEVDAKGIHDEYTTSSALSSVRTRPENYETVHNGWGE
jgi:hypothetical protein